MNEELKKWASDNLIWAGNQHTNKSERGKHIPEVIVNHISEGSAQSCIEWFTTSENKESSAHFLVTKKGLIYQFVPIEEIAWSNGLRLEAVKISSFPLIRERGVNPNVYTLSIEHEGIFEETKGALTSSQLKATVKLHEYLIAYVKDVYGFEIKPSKETIIGHNIIDPVTRSNCPGAQFPFDVIISQLKNEEPLIPSSDLTGHWAEKEIVKAKELGIVKGYVDGTFKPDANITRAEVVAMLMNLYNIMK